ncbi:MAG: acetate kinase [Desulfitibacter sp. BRH_c19]|nr:MAG: acetate kinase [Desulfitibacter sp. BRH_c19]
MKVLIVNSGSSSIKYQMFDMENESVLAKGLVERIGLEGALITYQAAGQDKYILETEIPNHEIGIKFVVESLTDAQHGVIRSMDEINAVGHRAVHGGVIAESVLIDDRIKEEFEKLFSLAPLHNPPGLMGMNACEKLMPNIPQVAVFDTAFHQTMSPSAYTYALPKGICEKHKIRRYGFHGTSHKFVARRAAEITGLDLNNSKIVTCHLGNGASITAVKNGKSVDTSMGLTPLEGLVMGTRCGNIDPAIVPFLMEKENLNIDQINQLMNKKSGVFGVSGVSSDFRDLEAAIEEGNTDAQLAIDVYIHCAKKIIGAYAAVLNGVDILVFTAGLGENSGAIREKICENMDYLGINIDLEINKIRGEEKVVSTIDSSTKVVVVPTNEELMIARETKEVLESIS